MCVYIYMCGVHMFSVRGCMYVWCLWRYCMAHLQSLGHVILLMYTPQIQNSIYHCRCTNNSNVMHVMCGSVAVCMCVWSLFVDCIFFRAVVEFLYTEGHNPLWPLFMTNTSSPLTLNTQCYWSTHHPVHVNTVNSSSDRYALSCIQALMCFLWFQIDICHL